MLNTLSTEEFQFIKAIEHYKAENRKTFLSWSADLVAPFRPTTPPQIP